MVIIAFSSTISGNLIFQWLLTQCNDYETKAEYERSHHLLTKFLLLPEMIKVMGTKFTDAIMKLQMNLAAKEEKYAGYV